MKQEIMERIFDFAYNEALNDATLQKAYEGSKKTIEDNVKARSVVNTYINQILEGANPDFWEAAKNVGACIPDTNFTFGNIQKLINMTVKYMFIACYANKGLRENFKDCHCPMDGIMIATVKEKYLNYLESNGNNKKDKLLQIPIGNGKTSIDISKIRWSKLSFEDSDSETSNIIYRNFQEMVSILAKKKNVFPIEYDFLLWKVEAENNG